MTISPGQIFIIGDSHIGLGDGHDQPVSAWIDRLRLLKPRALYLNGDLFHYLIAHPKFHTRSVARVFDKFRDLVDSGVALHYVEGNRDFFLQGSFVEDCVTDIALEYSIEAGARKYLIVHGDMINDRDWPYRFWRRVSKNAATKLALHFVPSRFARRFVDDMEKRLSQSNFKHKSELPIELMKAYGRKRGSEGYTDVVFGHFHKKLVLPTGGATVTILPPWYEEGEAMVVDPATGEFSFAVI